VAWKLGVGGLRKGGVGLVRAVLGAGLSGVSTGDTLRVRSQL